MNYFTFSEYNLTMWNIVETAIRHFADHPLGSRLYLSVGSMVSPFFSDSVAKSGARLRSILAPGQIQFLNRFEPFFS